MEGLLRVLLANAFVAGLLAAVAWVAARRLRRQAVVHGLWLLALVKLVTPPLVPLPLVPSLEWPTLVPPSRSLPVVVIEPRSSVKPAPETPMPRFPERPVPEHVPAASLRSPGAVSRSCRTKSTNCRETRTKSPGAMPLVERSSKSAPEAHSKAGTPKPGSGLLVGARRRARSRSTRSFQIRSSSSQRSARGAVGHSARDAVSVLGSYTKTEVRAASSAGSRSWKTPCPRASARRRSDSL